MAPKKSIYLTSPAQLRASTKYYYKMREDPYWVEDNRQYQRDRYNKVIDTTRLRKQHPLEYLTGLAREYYLRREELKMENKRKRKPKK